MKKLINFLIIFLIIILCFFYHKQIASFIINYIIAPKQEVNYKANSYMLNNNFSYLQIDDNFIPHNKKDIMNIFYTRLNEGVDEFYFYCDDKYKYCLDDVKKLTNNEEILSEINNFVHPFNSYSKLSINFDHFGKVRVNIKRLYSEAEIKAINNKIDEIVKNYINDNMSVKDKIKIFHDHIINNSLYDSEKAEAITHGHPLPTTYESQKAYGPLLQGMAICSGYSDSMAIFLDRLGIPNYKISSSNHIWNLVFIDNAWYHIDLTWDDPVTSDHSNIIIYDFFLINTNTLQSIDLTQHNFDKNIYKEAN
ncbi:MAG: hypothetical protein RR847_03490 [Bacilli bacterium]